MNRIQSSRWSPADRDHSTLRGRSGHSYRKRPYNRIRRVVGDHHLGPLATVEIQEEVEDVQAVAERARDDDGAQPGILVVDGVQPGRTAAEPEVVRIGSGVDRGDRDNEAQSVGAGDQSPTPGRRQVDPGLSRDEATIGRHDGFGPHVVLVDMREAVTGQRWHARLHDRAEADITRLGNEHGSDGDRQIVHPGAGFRDMGELVEAAGRSMHIQQEIRKIDLGQHARDRGAQYYQGSRFRHGLQLVEADPRSFVGQLEGGVVG